MKIAAYVVIGLSFLLGYKSTALKGMIFDSAPGARTAPADKPNEPQPPQPAEATPLGEVPRAPDQIAPTTDTPTPGLDGRGAAPSLPTLDPPTIGEVPADPMSPPGRTPTPYDSLNNFIPPPQAELPDTPGAVVNPLGTPEIDTTPPSDTGARETPEEEEEEVDEGEDEEISDDEEVIEEDNEAADDEILVDDGEEEEEVEEDTSEEGTE